MKTKTILLSVATALILTITSVAQDAGQSGFVISLKNGSTIRGRTLTRDDATGNLRLAMTETGAGDAKSYAIISPDDASEIRSSGSTTESITIKLRGGSQIKCKEFALNGDTVSAKLGSASRIEVQWNEIESISFAP